MNNLSRSYRNKNRVLFAQSSRKLPTVSIAEAQLVQYATLEHSAALNLNPRQISFVNNYIELKIGWKAAQAAGYSGDRFQLAGIASENLIKPHIQAYYLERLRELQISSDEVLAEIGTIARYDVIANPTGPIRTDHKLKALELAGKGHKLWADKVETELAPVDVERLSESLVTGLLAAAQKRREQEQPLQLPATTSPD